MKTRCVILVLFVASILSVNSFGQVFIHPGIDQSAADLGEMKRRVLQGRQPWKGAFDRLKAATDSTFHFKPYTHVLRGPYGRPNIGGDDLSKSAHMAYNYAMIWYITNDRSYAGKAMEILNGWSPVLWDFDYNDAKLLAAWTGHLLCNAAELLRYTNAGWQQKDIESFTHMLITVYYPLMRYYYTQANGNWDGAIIHSIMAMGIFTNNRKMFNNAVDHFLHAPFNGSIFKYIYPGGQCQETMRDQGHVQLGLGEFAGAAQVAFTQGVDLFSIGNNRIAAGYEFTAAFLLGSTPPSYGIISERSKNLRDDYEYVYQHYTSIGVAVPYTKIAADSLRSKASRSILSAVRSTTGTPVKTGDTKTGLAGKIAGARATAQTPVPTTAVMVRPGESIQSALDAAAGTGKWIVVKAGIHKFANSLKIPAGITLCGEGTSSVLFLDPASENRDALVNGADDIHDVTIRDLVIEGSNKTDPGTDPNSSRSYRGGYNRGGIVFRAQHEGQIKNINFTNLSVQNCTYNGVFISGGSNISITACDFNENGGSIVPGPKLQHNLLLSHCLYVTVKDSRLDTSPFGSGIALDHCVYASVTNCEVARNSYYGILVTESKNILITGNLIEANDRSGIMNEFLDKGSENVTINANLIHYNTGYGVETYGTKSGKVMNNTYAGNGNSSSQQKVSMEKKIIME